LKKAKKWDKSTNKQILEHASYSTQGKLIAPGIVVHGTISITATDLYFDTDEDHPLNKQLDPKVG
jgi:hypothetical protein